MIAGHDMILSTAGTDATNPLASNLYADNGTITAKVMDGTMSISNNGAVGAYANNGGSITLEGPVVMEVGSGAMVANSGTILFKGPVTLQSTATGLTADGGSITLDGDAAMDTDDGAAATNGGTILFNGPVTLQSTATGLTADGGSITLEGGAAMNTTDGALATNGGTILFNGPLTLHSTDTALRAVDGGVIQADAADTEKYMDGNVVAQGGTVSIDLNKAGSYLTGTTSVSDGTTSTLERAAVADSRAGTLNLTLGNGTVWNVTGDSSLTNLTNNGTVNMSGSNRTGQQVTAKTLSGTGTLVMDLDWLSNQGTKGVTANSDYLKVTDSATGTQALVSDPTVMNLDKMAVNDRLYVASLHNSDAVLSSSIQQRNVNKGHLYDYLIGLTHETTGDTADWYFGSVGTVESNAVPAAVVQNRTLFDLATHMDTLNKRLGEARYADGENSGMWARWTYRHLGRDSYDGHGNRFELGYDDTDKRDDGSTLRQGLSFSYLKSRTSFAEGQGKYKGYTGSFYQTWLGQKGHYLDVVGRIGKVNGEGTTKLFNGDESKSSFGTWYQQASVEWGRKKVLNNQWYIEPQSQIQYTHINGKNYRTSDGISQDFDSMNSFIGRLGFRLGRDIDAKTAWYFKADILHEFAGNRTFDLTSLDGLEYLHFDKSDHDTWYDVGAGITAELSHDRSLWFEFERTFNGSYGRDWELNAGMTWRFH
ncbi:autotransporter outer membrane beta-barrel domain-containing protein [uncultured Megasphaera sp.]|uniref:autotransporter outer membrane beta-barrel domain-containing protein n=4 Tax=Megasphaera TaxID=906 RepID=UPI00265F9B14|nr:autotransporter outer membrane beta-barrel domain-containing protein [uncultured Megasphaera sp.]